MSESDKPGPSDVPSIEEVKTKAKAKVNEKLDEAPPEVQEAVEKGKSFYEQNKKTIHTVLVGVVVLRVYKRKVAKASAKAVIKALENLPQEPSMPTMVEIAEQMRKIPEIRYIAPGGGAVHALLNKDIVITLIRDGVEKMNNLEIDRAIREAWNRRDF